MLILTRNKGQSIVIDNVIKVYVLDVTGNQVRLGIEAPPHISINRSEIQEKIDEGA